MLFLLSLRYEDAIALDADPPCSASTFSPEGPAGESASSVEDEHVPAIARWHDVRAARRRVQQSARELLILHMRALEFTEREVAAFFEMSQPTVHRTVRTRLEDILRELGGEAEPPERTSQVSACIICGARPRARLAERRRRVKGGWKVISLERMSSLCRVCTPEERRELLVPGRHDDG